MLYLRWIELFIMNITNVFVKCNFGVMKMYLKFESINNREIKMDKNKKVDKGFELAYAKLSYRRRFIRTLWLIPWAILVLYGLYWVNGTKSRVFITLIIGIIFVIGIIIQASYNYKKWKKEENNKTNGNGLISLRTK